MTVSTIVDFIFYQKTDGPAEIVWLLYYQDSPQWAGWQVPNRTLPSPEEDASVVAAELAAEFGATLKSGSLKKVADTEIVAKNGQSPTPFMVYEAEVTRASEDPYLGDRRLYAPFTPEDALYTDLVLQVRDTIAERYGLQHLKEVKSDV